MPEFEKMFPYGELNWTHSQTTGPKLPLRKHETNTTPFE
jgi:hypothetical protein